MTPHPFDPASVEAGQPLNRRSGWTSAVALILVLFMIGAAFFIGRATKSVTQAGQQQRWTCSMHPWVIEPMPGICPICHMELTPITSSSTAGNTLTIDPVVVQNMGVRLAEVTRGPIVQSVRVVGYLEEPEPLHHDINLRVSGWIEKLYANIDGMPVTQNQPLFDLYSPELTLAIDELIAARRQMQRAPEEQTARSLLDSARRKLAQFGLTHEQIDHLALAESAPPTVPILSPMDGHLTAKMVYAGAAVKAGDLVMRLASRHQMWIDAQVPEQQMPLISDGQPARTTLVSQPGKVYRGKVLFVHPHLDPQTRTALVRIEIDNADLSLRQGMYATVEILADAYREAPLIPREAVIDTGRRQLVFISLGEGRFAPREVILGLSAQEGMVEVVQGLEIGQTVVTSGQFLLDSESRLKEAVAKHLSSGLPGHQHGTAAVSQGDVSVDPPATVPATERVVVPHVGDILKAYLAITRQLGARQESETPIDPHPLIDVAERAAQHGEGEGKALAERIALETRGMLDKSISEQRELFVTVSDAVIQLVRRGASGDDVPATLYVMHCPMAFHDQGAYWLQDQQTVENPFYATQMKRCGEVVETIAPQE